MPHQQVVRYGDAIGSHGADVISVNTKTGEVTLWDAKYRCDKVKIQQSTTFAKGSPARKNAIQQALSAIGKNAGLTSSIRDKAFKNLEEDQLTTRTVAFGEAKNSVIGK